MEVALLGLITIRKRRSDSFDGPLAAIALVATLVNLWALTRVRGDILRYETLRFTAVGALNLGVIGAAAVNEVWPRLAAAVPLKARQVLWTVAIACACALGLRDLESMTSFERRMHARSPIVPGSRAVQSYLSANRLSRPLIEIGPDLWGEAAGIALRLRQAGIPATVPAANVPMFTDALAETGHEDTVISIVDLGQHRLLRERANNAVLLQSFPIFLDALQTGRTRDLQ
jgi:hypothetical protein